MKQELLMKKQEKIPVKEGQVLTVIPTGIGAKQDPYYRLNGYIIFIKDVPKELYDEEIIIKVLSVQKTYGFAIYEGRP